MTKKIYTFHISGRPTALQRPRITRYGAYDPQQAKKEEAALELRHQRKDEGLRLPLEGPLKLVLTFYMPLSSVAKRLGFRQLDPHFKRPDIDNLIKYVLDVGNKVLWKDDATIVSVEASKIYFETPFTLITIESFTQDE